MSSYARIDVRFAQGLEVRERPRRKLTVAYGAFVLFGNLGLGTW